MKRSAPPLGEADRRIVDLFVDGVRVIGLPKSIGEIYGLLFVSREPLSLDDLVFRLGISKGSASQGLRMLRGLGAVLESDGNGGRRTYYEPEISLKRLVGGFIREQVVPHLKSGRSKLAELADDGWRDRGSRRAGVLPGPGGPARFMVPSRPGGAAGAAEVAWANE